jgi:SPP1 gp7 family putative phage head morphogenesis protein
MRRGALSENAPTAEEQTGGGFPFDQVLRLAGDPEDPTRVSFPTLRRMRRDHMIAMGLYFIIMPVLKASWYFECDSARAAAFADNLIRPIYGRLVLTIMRMLWAGYSPGYKPFELVRPNWVYYDDSFQPHKVWDSLNVDALVYKPVIPLKPELCRPKWDGNGGFGGIKYDSRYGDGYFLINGQRKKEINLVHSLWATHGQEDEDNRIYGFPRIAHAAPIHQMYWYLWTLIGRAFENNADPGPVMRYPQEDIPLSDDDGNTMPNVKVALTMGRRKRSGSTIGLPSTPYTDFTDRPTNIKKWDIEYPKNETDFKAIMDMLGFLETLKLRALLIQEQGMIADSGAQSNRNVASEFGQKRDESQVMLMDYVMSLIDETFVKPAFAMQAPWFEGSIKMKALGLGQDDEDTVRQVFQLVGQENWRNFGIDVRRLAESRGFPMADPAAQAKMLESAAKQAETSATPPVQPTDGRRAVVTQTGFGETVYVQQGGHIDLPAGVVLDQDGDFVAGLPKTVHFGDRVVLDGTRALRRFSSAYISNLYNDFARHVGRQHALEFEENLSDEEFAPKLIDRLLSSWKPRAERALTFANRASSSLAKIFDRTGTIQLKDIGSDKRISSTDKAAAAWLQQQGAQLVTGVTETVRNELRDFMAREVKKGTTPTELALKIRTEFSQWPEWKASMIARTETSEAFNYATLLAGQSAGIKKVQILDGNDDRACRKRNGKIVGIAEAMSERLAHPNCQLGFRLLPRANLSVRTAPTEGTLFARFDEETDTVLLSPDISEEDETKFLLAVGEHVTA